MTPEIPSPQPAPVAYSIQTLTDMLKVPSDRRGVMLRELEMALLTHELAFGDEAPNMAANMTWTDDGDRTVDITANGKPLLKLKVEKKAGATPAPEGGERAAFEADIRKRLGLTDGYFNRDPDGYANEVVEASWQGWKARAAQQTKEPKA